MKPPKNIQEITRRHEVGDDEMAQQVKLLAANLMISRTSSLYRDDKNACQIYHHNSHVLEGDRGGGRERMCLSVRETELAGRTAIINMKAMLTWLMPVGNQTLKAWLTGTLKVLEVAEERIYLNWKHLTVRHL